MLSRSPKRPCISVSRPPNSATIACPAAMAVGSRSIAEHAHVGRSFQNGARIAAGPEGAVAIDAAWLDR